MDSQKGSGEQKDLQLKICNAASLKNITFFADCGLGGGVETS